MKDEDRILWSRLVPHTAHLWSHHCPSASVCPCYRDLRGVVRLDIHFLLQSGPEADKFPALPDPRRFSVVERDPGSLTEGKK